MMKHFYPIDDEVTLVELRENIMMPISLRSIKITPSSVDEVLQETTEIDDEEPTRDETFNPASSKNNFFALMKNFATATYDNFKSIFR